MKRADVLVWIRIAGYHEDNTAMLRLYVEHHVNKKAALEAYEQGRQQRLSGIPCRCFKCTKGAPR